MGGGDLNLKKSWHPSTFHNQEKVWKREQEAEAERKKLEQWRKEQAEERGREELQALNDGRANKVSTRLEWMYAVAPGTAPSEITEDKEAYLLGKKRIDKLVDQGTAVADLSATTVFAKDTKTMYGMAANTVKDMQAKIREDPLLQIKKREQAAIEAVLNNPIRLKHLAKDSGHAMVGDDDSGGKRRHSRDAKKKDKSDKKDKKKKKKDKEHRKRSRDGERRSVSPESRHRHHHRRRRSASPSVSPDRRADLVRGRSPEPRRRDDKRRQSRSPVRNRSRSSVSSSSSSSSISKSRNGADHSRRGEDASRDRYRDDDRHRDRNSYHERRHDQHQSHSRFPRDQDRRGYYRSRDQVASPRSTAVAPPSSTVPNAATTIAAAATTTVASSAVTATSTSKAPTATQNPQDYAEFQRLKEEERERRLQAMKDNANRWDQEREQRVTASRQKDEAEAKAELVARLARLKSSSSISAGESFAADLHRRAFMASDASIADMVRRNRASAHRE